MIEFAPRPANEWVTAVDANVVYRANGTCWPVSGDASVKRDGHYAAHDIDVWQAPNVSGERLTVTERAERYSERCGRAYRGHGIEPGDVVTIQGVGELIVTQAAWGVIAGYRESETEPGRWVKQSFRPTMVTKHRKPGTPE